MSHSAHDVDREHGLDRLAASISGQPDAISQAITANFDGIRASAVLLAGARRPVRRRRVVADLPRTGQSPILPCRDPIPPGGTDPRSPGRVVG